MILTFLYSLCFIELLILFHFNLSYNFKILQQSFYHTFDYIYNTKNSKTNKNNMYQIVLFGVMFLNIFVSNIYINFMLFLIFCIVIVFAIKDIIKIKKIEKKKFVITNRIKILYIISYMVIFGIFLLGSVIDIKYILSIFAIYKIYSMCIVVISNILSMPIINSLNYRYIKEAKDILKNHKDLKIIGITGSYGKTSTKNIITSILKERYNTVMTPKSYNTTLGVTKTIREDIKPYTEIFVCEMGASRLGDIKKICNIVKPDISVITSIGKQHLLTFKNIENIIKEKFNIVKMSKNDGVCVLNVDNCYIKDNYLKYSEGKKVLKYSLSNSTNCYAENILMSENGSTFDIVIDKEKINIETRLLGKHNIYNILCAVLIAKNLGMENTEIKRAIKNIKQVEHRLELKYINDILVLDDSFNSNPEGSKMAIECLKMFKNKYKVLVTPGMVELGKKEEILNRMLGKYATCCDFVILEKSNISKYVKEGMDELNYRNYVLVDGIYEAFGVLSDMNKKHENLIALIENDLPDCYI